MANLANPPAIIFVNNDLTQSIEDTIKRQFFISESITGEEFDVRVTNDEAYPEIVKLNDLRILVKRSFYEQTNRNLADIVIFVKAGLASVEYSNVGPPGLTMPIDKMYLSDLFFRK